MLHRRNYGALLFASLLGLSACADGIELPKWQENGWKIAEWSTPSKEKQAATTEVAANKDFVTVTVLHTNDFHSQLEPFRTAGEPEQGGAARNMALISKIRTEKGPEHVLLLSGGDNFQGSFFYNTWKGSAEIMVLNHMHYDAVTPGNHEFDLGSKEYGRALRGEPVEIGEKSYNTEKADFPIVASNIDVSNEPALKNMLVKNVVIKKGGVEYGFVGATTETTSTVSSPGPNVKFLDYITSVQTQVDALEKQGINKIFLMSHTGYEEDIKLIQHVHGVDVVIAGHDHALLGDKAVVAAMGLPKQVERVKGPYPTVVKGKDGQNVVVVSAMEKGRWLGQIDVTFDAQGHVPEGGWKANQIFVQGCTYTGEKNAEAADCSKEVAKPDPELAAIIAEYNKPIEGFANEVVGKAAVDLGGRKDSADAPPMGDVVADILLNYAKESDKAQASVVNRGGIRSGIMKGTVLFKDVNAVLPFENTITTVEMTGEELVEAMDHGLTEANGKSYGAWPHVAGMIITYCPAKPCAKALRTDGIVTAISVGKVPVDMKATYRIATNDYLAHGGDFYAAFKQACERAGGYCRDSGALLRDVVADWIRKHSPVLAPSGGRLIPAH